ncbi:hypothetical protein FQN54_007802 [Arachnomyces sp. PD_36]|nr:hypothetical protein FQN54_007802 [Arachnomyces sp. PD_36]
MSLSRHVYRHAHHIDHVWISDDFLAATFSRFISQSPLSPGVPRSRERLDRHCHQQRRCGSSVPGPLEARRRLAKRRNTDMARMGGADQGAMAMMFGRKGMLKWEGKGMLKGEGKGRLKREGKDSNSLPVGLSPDDAPFNGIEGQSTPLDTGQQQLDRTTMDEILEQRIQGLSPEDAPFSGVEGQGTPFDTGQQQLDPVTMDEILEQRIQNVHDLNGIKSVLRELSLDLRQEPGFSQLIFNRILERGWEVEELSEFLKDPLLNVNGAGNFVSMVEYLRTYETTTDNRHRYFKIMYEALRLGLIPLEEIALIIRLTPTIRIGSGTLRSRDQRSLGFCYKMMWDGIEACSILDPEDLGDGTLNLWLDEIAQTPSNPATLELGARIVRSMVMNSSPGDGCRWAPMFMAQWMSLSTRWVVEDVQSNRSSIKDLRTDEDYRYITSLLYLFNADLRVKYIIDVTEFLAFSLKEDEFRYGIMEAWKLLLAKVTDPWALLSSLRWGDIDSLSSDLAVATELNPETHGFHAHHRCLLRIWVVRKLGAEFTRTNDQVDQVIDMTIPNQRTKLLELLIAQFHHLSWEWDDSDLFTSLLNSIRDLNLPYNSIMISTAMIRARRRVPRGMLRTFRELERGTITLTDLFSNYKSYHNSKPYFFPAYARMACNTDVTTPSFIQRAMRIVENDEEGRSCILRLLRRHTPLKIALSRSWDNQDASLPPEWTKDPPSPSQPTSSPPAPSPAAALELLNLLALSFACSKRLPPRTSYRLVYWCYLYLMAHQAPLKPVISRALYHSGVTKYRERGQKVTTMRFQWVMGMVEKIEGPEVANRLMGR